VRGVLVGGAAWSAALSISLLVSCSPDKSPLDPSADGGSRGPSAGGAPASAGGASGGTNEGGEAGQGGAPGGAGSTEALECPEGMFGDPELGCSGWATCSAGERVHVAGTSVSDRECEVCPRGTFSTQMNSVDCQTFTTCEKGEFIESSGDERHDQVCGVCEAGTFSGSEDSAECTPCPEGTFAADDGASSCAPWTRCGFGEGIQEEGSDVRDSICVVASASRQFGTTTSDAATSVQVDADGNIYVAGQTDGQLGAEKFGKTDVFVRKYDSGGVELWTLQLGSVESDSLAALALGPDGVVYITGQTLMNFPGQDRLGEIDAYLVKIRPSGEVAWSRQFGTEASDSGSSLTVTSTGDVLVAGKTQGALGDAENQGGSDAFLVRFDGEGTLNWSHQLGTSENDEATGVAYAPSGHVYLAGNVGGILVQGQGGAGVDMFLRRFDPEGVPVWTTQFGSSRNDRLEAIALDQDGNAIVVGEVGGSLPGKTSVGLADWFVRKYGASDAAIKRTHQAGSAALDRAVGVTVGLDGSVVIVGVTDGTLSEQEPFGARDVFVSVWSEDLKTETYVRQLGSEKEDSVFGVSERGAEGGYFVAGTTEGQLPDQNRLGEYDAFLSLIKIP
jgi:Tyrosine-protein kinase ephrin type A/B receptor-like/Beta-propeller repeat